MARFRGVTTIDGPSERSAFCGELISMHEEEDIPWILVGDFSVVQLETE